MKVKVRSSNDEREEKLQEVLNELKESIQPSFKRRLILEFLYPRVGGYDGWGADVRGAYCLLEKQHFLKRKKTVLCAVYPTFKKIECKVYNPAILEECRAILEKFGKAIGAESVYLDVIS